MSSKNGQGQKLSKNDLQNNVTGLKKDERQGTTLH